MSRRRIVAPTATLVAALIATLMAAFPLLASGTASDDACTREPLPRAAQTTASVDALFAAADAAESIETESGVSIEMPAMEVVVARIGADGKVILGCVDSAAAAKRFLDAPIEKVPRKAAAEK